LTIHIKVQPGSDYTFCGVSYAKTPVLGLMLNNKAKIAYNLLQADKTINIPQYVKDAFAWVRS